LSFSVQPSSTADGSIVTPAIQVRLLDASGQLVVGATDNVAITISSNPGGGTLSGTTSRAAVGGVATFANLSIDKRGERYGLAATAKGYVSASSVVFNVFCPCWSLRAPMPIARYGFGVGVVNGILYALGGYGGGGWTTTVEAYSPMSNTWTTKAPMPTARASLGVGVVNGILYAVGGSNSSGYLATVEAFDPVANTWTTKAPMPTARAGLDVGVVSGILYAVGGFNSSGYLATAEAYDPVANTWTTKAPMPTPRSLLAVGVVNGILYAVGGSNSIGPLATVEAYDPVANTWTTKAPTPTPRSLLAVGVVSGILYGVGGHTIGLLGTVGVATVESYDPVANAWTTKGPMPTAGSGGVGVVDGILYSVQTGGNSLGTLEAYDPFQEP